MPDEVRRPPAGSFNGRERPGLSPHITPGAVLLHTFHAILQVSAANAHRCRRRATTLPAFAHYRGVAASLLLQYLRRLPAVLLARVLTI